MTVMLRARKSAKSARLCPKFTTTGSHCPSTLVVKQMANGAATMQQRSSMEHSDIFYRYLLERTTLSVHSRSGQGRHLQGIFAERCMPEWRCVRPFSHLRCPQGASLPPLPPRKMYKRPLPVYPCSSEPTGACLSRLCYLRILRKRRQLRGTPYQ
jgi:hypothetical protein